MTSTPSFDMNGLRLAATSWSAAAAPPRHRRGEWFLKGPIPLKWLAQASGLPGKALHVGVAIWFLAGMKKSSTVSLAAAVLRTFGVSRHSVYRALSALESAALVSVDRHRGRNPIVTLLEAGQPQPTP
jgi:hypothetical protein